MTQHIFSRAAKRADQLIATITDRLNGNTVRRRVLRQRLQLAMLASERHQIVAARAAQRHSHGVTRPSALLHWRTEFHRNAI